MDITGLFLLLLTVIIFSYIGLNYSKGKKFTIEDFITARGSIRLSVSVASLYASAMGAWILFSPPEATINAGITALIGYAVGSAAALWIFMWLGLKLRSLMPSGHTITEYVLLRYGRVMYAFVLLISCFYMGVFLTAELTGIALANQMVFGVPIYITSIVVGIGTLLYTTAGGLRASIFTDTIQSWFILPLLLIVFASGIFFLGGFETTISSATKIAPQLLDLSYIPGIVYGFTLIIAIVGAELFNQGNWQRIYSARNADIMRKSFLYAGLLVIPTIILVGLFGIFAVASGTADVPSVAFFSFLMLKVPKFVLLLTMILATILIMSTMDTLLNGLVSLFTVDLARILPKRKEKNILSLARWITVIIAAIAIFISTYGFSVLYLFLIADLICVAAAFPTFYGLYSKKYNSSSAILSAAAGIIAGAFYFPNTSFTRGSLFLSFLIALAVPIVISLTISHFSKNKKEFNFEILKKEVKAFKG